MTEQQAKTLAEQLELCINSLQRCLDIIREGGQVGPAPQKQEIKAPESKPQIDYGPTPNIDDPAWPEAVSPKLANLRSVSEKQLRALQIIELTKLKFDGKTILDYGCGEGYVSFELAHAAKKVVGYDPQESPSWEVMGAGNLHLLSDLAGVAYHAPYDYIVLFDVLDHMADGQVATLAALKAHLAPGGKIFVRTHPWTGRHGGHLYEHGYNKAFAHLALTTAEWAARGVTPPEVFRLERPIATYETWFKKAGLVIEHKKAYQGDDLVESYFDGPIMDRILRLNWTTPPDVATAKKIMANQFMDYLLSKAIT